MRIAVHGMIGSSDALLTFDYRPYEHDQRGAYSTAFW